MKLNFVSRDLRSLFTLVILLAAAVAASGQDNANFSIDTSPLPAPTGFVNDFAGVIDAATKQQLEAKITQFKQSTNPQVELAVAVVKTTGDRDIFDYSLAVARGWKIGSKADDNPSALLFIAIDDRKYFTQVSRDLEDELPDSLAGSIQRQYLVPEFKKGNYSKGISDTIDAYIKTIQARSSGTAAPAAGTNGTDSGTSGIGRSGFNLFCCFIVFIVLMVIIFSRGHGKDKNDKNRWGGGGGFGGGGSALPWIIGSILSSGGGGSSSSSNWGGSSGGGWGGFGGGGDFGGGGAGGSW